MAFSQRYALFSQRYALFSQRYALFSQRYAQKKAPFSCSSGRREFSHKGTQNRPFLRVFSQRYAFSHKGTQNYPFSPKSTRIYPNLPVFSQKYAFSHKGTHFRPGRYKRERPLSLDLKKGLPKLFSFQVSPWRERGFYLVGLIHYPIVIYNKVANSASGAPRAFVILRYYTHT